MRSWASRTEARVRGRLVLVMSAIVMVGGGVQVGGWRGSWWLCFELQMSLSDEARASG